MSKCPVIDKFVEEVRSNGDAAWDTEMDARDITNTKTTAAVELARVYACADWSVRTILVDELTYLDCLVTADRIFKLSGDDAVGLRIYPRQTCHHRDSRAAVNRA